MKIKSMVFALALGTTLGAVSVGHAIDRENGLLKKIFNRRASNNVKITEPTKEPPVVAPVNPEPASKEAKKLPVGQLNTVKENAITNTLSSEEKRPNRQPNENAIINTLSSEEKALGFELIFNGKDYQGWENKGNWIVEEGAIARKDKGGDIAYTAKKVPDNFELRFEWKVGKGSNSGIYYRPGQYEYQILDNKVHNDGKNPRTSASSLYYCMPPSKDATNPVGEWNSGRIVCKGTVIQHWLNGVKVIDFDYKDAKYAWEVELLKVRGANLDARGANFRIQDHGDPVWFRSVKLRELKDSDQLDKTPVPPVKIAEEIVKREQAYIDSSKKKK